MMNAIAQRHLRDAPSAPIVHSFSEVPRVAAPERSSSAQPGATASLSLGEHWAFNSASLTVVPGVNPFPISSSLPPRPSSAEEQAVMFLDTKGKLDAPRRDSDGSTARCSTNPLMWMQWLQIAARKPPTGPPYCPLPTFSSICEEFGDP